MTTSIHKNIVSSFYIAINRNIKDYDVKKQYKMMCSKILHSNNNYTSFENYSRVTYYPYIKYGSAFFSNFLEEIGSLFFSVPISSSFRDHEIIFDGLKDYLKKQDLRGNFCHVKAEETDEYTRFVFNNNWSFKNKKRVAFHEVVNVFFYVSLIRFLSGELITPLSVSLTHDVSEEDKSTINNIFSDIRIEKSKLNSIVFKRSDLERKSLFYCLEKTQGFFNYGFEGEIIKVINHLLDEETYPYLDDVCTHLNISKRSIQRELKKRKLSFREIQSKTVANRAKDLIRNGLSVKETAYKLGYSCSNSFIRFYKNYKK